MSSDSWGEHRVTAELEDTNDGTVIETLEVCADVPQEMEPASYLRTS